MLMQQGASYPDMQGHGQSLEHDDLDVTKSSLQQNRPS